MIRGGLQSILGSVLGYNKAVYWTVYSKVHLKAFSEYPGVFFDIYLDLF